MQVDVYGALTQAEERRMQQRLAEAGRAPQRAPQVERKLLDGAGDNCYCKALVLTEIAAYRQTTAEQVLPFRPSVCSCCMHACFHALAS